MAKSKVRAVIYCRCSTEEESQRNALIQQVHEAKECLEHMGWTLSGEYVESKSGTSISGRSAYLKLLRDLEQDFFDVVVIKSIDRLMRNVKDWYLFLERLVQNEKRLYLYLEQKFYTPEDNLIVGIKAILAEDYSRELSKKINNAHHHRQQKGKVTVLTSRTFGYTKLPDHSVAVDESERKIIERIFLLASIGYGGDRISNILYEEGVRNRAGKKLYDTSIRRIIRNPIYKGLTVMNRRHYDFELKKIIKLPESEWIYHEGLVPPIVSANLWEKANEQMNLRSRVNRPAFDRVDFSDKRNEKANNTNNGKNCGKSVLSGKLTCGCCGAPYYRTVQYDKKKSKTRNNPDAKVFTEAKNLPNNNDFCIKNREGQSKFFVWRCHTYIQYGRASKKLRKNALRKSESKNRSAGCDNIHLPEQYLIDLLLRTMKERYNQNDSDRDSIIDQAMLILKDIFESDKTAEESNLLMKEKDTIAIRKDVLLDKLLDGVITDRDYHMKSRLLDDREKAIEDKLDQINRAGLRQIAIQDRLKEIRRKIDEVGIDQATAEEMIEEIGQIRVYPDYLMISFEAFAVVNLEQAEDLCIRIPVQDQGMRGRSKGVQDRICQCMIANPETTAKQIAQETGLGISCIQYQIRKLRKEGRVEFLGKGGVGRWNVKTLENNSLTLYNQGIDEL